MIEPTWVIRESVLILHEQSLAEHGGFAGLRDPELLDSALGMPLTKFNNGAATHFHLAALYASGITNKRPFTHGNERSAFIVAVTFLELNGYRFAGQESDAAVRTLALAAGEMSDEDFASWLGANSKKKPKRK